MKPKNENELIDLTENELIELLVNQLQLEEQGGGDAGFVTAKQIREFTGWSLNKTQKQVRKLFDQGRLEVRKVRRTDIVGRPVYKPGYRLIQGD